jgi:hypothetical protein
MTNANERAKAQAMPSDRRGFLRSALAIGATAAAVLRGAYNGTSVADRSQWQPILPTNRLLSATLFTRAAWLTQSKFGRFERLLLGAGPFQGNGEFK